MRYAASVDATGNSSVLSAACCGGPDAPKLTIKATAPTITAEATIMRGVSTSPANAQPSSTATTGFTYAYVETRAGVETVSRYMYAEKAMSEPKVNR